MGREAILSLADVDFSFVDILASVEVMVGKPGYGSIAEVAANGIPFIYLKREDWPEEPYLLEWFHQNGKGIAVDKERYFAGDFIAEIERLIKEKPVPVAPIGIEQVADIILPYLKKLE